MAMANVRDVIVNELRRVADLAEDNRVCTDYVQYRVDCLTGWIVQFEADTDTDLDPVILQNLDEVSRRLTDSVYRTSVGRPRHLIPTDVLESLLLSGFNVPDVARLFSVCERTIHRRMAENGIRSVVAYILKMLQKQFDDLQSGY